MTGYGASLILFAGGVGLFLLGMRLMSDGLKVAAGPALRHLLSSATRSIGRGFASGLLITALVQSSSAVIFAIIGFVNAGLLSLGQAIGLVFGANVGTTLTGWIVALVGFNVDLHVLAMPAIAVGMALWISSRGRPAALGQALAGFGIFFLGLDALKDSFTDVGDVLDLHALDGSGVLGLLAFAGIGVVLTVLMQSSSAALAVTLTAAAGGLMPLSAGAAMVIGANIGTTSTAVLASLGATSAAHRVAAAHVVFNLVAGLAALLALPGLLAIVGWITATLSLAGREATSLAMFHTLANLLGVVLMWPARGVLVRWLDRRFLRAEEDEARPRYLDRTVMATPHLALDALRLELRRIGAIAHRMARSVLSSEAPQDGRLDGEHDAIERLSEATIEFAGGLDSSGDAVVEAGQPAAVRVAQYYRGMAERAVEWARAPRTSELPPGPAQLMASLRAAADQALALADPNRQSPADDDALRTAASAFEDTYRHSKDLLLRAGGHGMIGSTSLVRTLDEASAMRRIVDQAIKAARYLAAIGSTEPPAAAGPPTRPPPVEG
ncbi:MAG TPA: Na/Pi-cotransporter II-like protein [Xanthomonadales bacterium]|nr:Na/Pi-cotransporter II-like protein [Xanthomonadales bacterium]